MKKRLVAFVMVFAIVFTMMPVMALAADPGQGPQTEKLVLPADVGVPISVSTDKQYQLFSDNDTPITSTTITVKDSKDNGVGNSDWAISDLDQTHHLGGQGVEVSVPGSGPATIMFRSGCNGQYSVTVGTTTTYTFEVTGGNPGQGGTNIILDKNEGVGFVGAIDCAYPIFYTENDPVFKDDTVTSISVTHKVDGKDVEVGNSNWTNQDIESKGLGNAAVEVMLSPDQPATILFRVECGGDYTVSLGSQSFNIKINATNGLTSGHGWGNAKTQQVINLSTVSSTSDTRLLCEIDYLLLEEVGKPVSKDSTIIVKDKNGNVVGNSSWTLTQARQLQGYGVEVIEDDNGIYLRFKFSCGSEENFLVPQDYTIIVDGKSYPVKLEGGGGMGDGDNVSYYAIVPQFVSSSGNTIRTCSVLDTYNPTSPVLVSHIDSNTPDQNHPGQTLASVVESGSIDITGSNGEYTVTLNDLVMNNGQLLFIAEPANTGKQIKINLVLNGQSKLYNGAELGMEYADVTVTGLGRLDIINGRIDAWNSKINFLGGITHIDASGVEKPAVAVTGSYSDVDITTSGVMIMTAEKDITVRRGNYYCALANDSMTYDFNTDKYTGYAKKVTIAPYMVDASATEIPKELSALVNPVIGVNSEAKSEEILKGEAENLLDLIMNGYDVGDRITEDVYNDILEALASADILGLTPIARTEILDDDEVPSADSKKVEDKVKALNDPTAEIVCFANISIGLYGTDNKWYGNLNEIDENMSFAIAITPEQLEMYDGM